MSCNDDEGFEPAPVPEPSLEVEKVSEYHEKIRTRPYPLPESTIFVNPAPLIVPQNIVGRGPVEFELSPDSAFATGVIASGVQNYLMFSPHRRLDEGRWFWRYRVAGAEWADTLTFDITGAEAEFVTPPFEVFLANAPKRHPRLNCYADAGLEQMRPTIKSHPEYRMLVNRADEAMKLDLSDVHALYASYEDFMNGVDRIADAYVVSLDERYASKLIAVLDAITASPASDAELFTENFATSSITYIHTVIYDLLYTRLDAGRRAAAEEQMMRALTRYFATNIGYQENHIFDNHFWQKNLRVMFQTAFALYDNPAYAAEVLPILEYYYELWCTRAPAGGFSRDGLWQNGVGYMTANIRTLAYMPKLLSYVTRFDFLSHPWYRAAGRSLCYSCPTGSMGVGFGDQSERYKTTNRQYPAFADFLAAETGDDYACWYASQNASLLRADVDLRLYRMTRSTPSYAGEQPDEVSNLIVYPDAGEVAMHSNIGDTTTDLALAFRSSGFGSGSHTTASQNAFNLYYGGSPVFHSSGYYQNFSDAHNLMSYRHSRAHNTILVNGIGQPYTTRAYGSMVRAGGGATLCYALGDASNAYCGTTDDPMWLNAFAAAGISQTPDNGFGSTPLTRYRRHVAMLQGGVVVLYDELAASETAAWDWLLHSDTPFAIDGAARTAEVESARTCSRVSFFTADDMTLSQTSRFAVPPAVQGEQYPDQWHLTAKIEGAQSVYILTVIQTCDKIDEPAPIAVDGNTVKVGQWTISAELDSSKSPSLLVVNTRTATGLSFGSEPLVIGDKTYSRSYTNSTIVVDRTGAGVSAEELVDATPSNSRNR